MAGDNRGSKVSLYFLKAECNTSWTMSKVISERISVHGTTQYVLTHLPRELRFSYATVYRFTLQASLVCKKNSELPTNWKKKKDKKVSLLNELGDEKEETFDVRKETQFFWHQHYFFLTLEWQMTTQAKCKWKNAGLFFSILVWHAWIDMLSRQITHLSQVMLWQNIS